MRKVAIVNGGLSRFGARQATWKELAQEAGKAMFDSIPELDRKDVDSLFVGAADPDRFAFQSHVAPMVAEQIGVTPTKVITRTELMCSSGQSAIRHAWMSIATGMSDIAVCLGVEKMNTPSMPETQTSMACVLDREWDGVQGASAPPFFAMVAQRHMKEYGPTRDQLSMVSVKNHHYSTMNPFAHFQKEVPLEKVAGSLMVAPPLTLLDCSGITDGAAGIVLAEESIAKKLTETPIHIIGSAQCAMGNILNGLPSLTTWEPLRSAAKEAFRSAKITSDDVDVAEIHDCFTISEIVEYEDFGFCEKGQGGKFIEDGQSEIGGKVAVNTRGGLLGSGHPLGATGIAQAIEVMQQLRGEAPQGRAVDGAEIGLSHNLSGAANVHSILVYKRGSA